MSVKLCRPGQPNARRSVHRLVLEAFAGPCPDGMECLHGPGGPLDNRWPDNIRWGTREDNQGPDRVRDGTSNRGTNNGQARLTEAIVRDCRRRKAAGETTKALAREYGVSPKTMILLLRRVNWAWLD
jgi:hypothetical protein